MAPYILIGIPGRSRNRRILPAISGRRPVTRAFHAAARSLREMTAVG